MAPFIRYLSKSRGNQKLIGWVAAHFGWISRVPRCAFRLAWTFGPSPTHHMTHVEMGFCSSNVWTFCAKSVENKFRSGELLSANSDAPSLSGEACPVRALGFSVS